MQVNEVMTRLAASRKLLEHAVGSNQQINATTDVVVRPATWLRAEQTVPRLEAGAIRSQHATDAYLDARSAHHQLQQVLADGNLDTGTELMRSAHADVHAAATLLSASNHQHGDYVPLMNLPNVASSLRNGNGHVKLEHTPQLERARSLTTRAHESLRFDAAVSGDRDAQIDAALRHIAAQDAPALSQGSSSRISDSADAGLADVFASAALGQRALGA